jgi:hypothetical protein
MDWIAGFMDTFRGLMSETGSVLVGRAGLPRLPFARVLGLPLPAFGGALQAQTIRGRLLDRNTEEGHRGIPDPCFATNGGSTTRHGAASTLILATFFLHVFSASDLGAQGVRGRLRDLEAGTPILFGRLTLLDADSQAVTINVTDTEGEFLLLAPEGGQYWIRIESPFHRGYTDGPISLAGTDTVSLTYDLMPLPVEMDELTVEAERLSPRLTMEGVYYRREAGIGVHINERRIRARPGGRVADLIALLPMVELKPDTMYDELISRVVFRKRQFDRLGPPPPPCYPQVFLNGALLAAGGRVPGDLDIFSLADLEAIEVYESPVDLPHRFYGQFAQCGTILLWTG